MDDCSGILPSSVDCRVKQHASFIHPEIGAALINDTAIRINFEQTRGCYFVVHKSKGVNQEAVLVGRRANLAKHEIDID